MRKASHGWLTACVMAIPGPYQILEFPDGWLITFDAADSSSISVSWSLATGCSKATARTTKTVCCFRPSRSLRGVKHSSLDTATLRSRRPMSGSWNSLPLGIILRLNRHQTLPSCSSPHNVHLLPKSFGSILGTAFLVVVPRLVYVNWERGK